MRFEFATATRIIFGVGTVKEVAPIASSWGRRALVVTGRGQTQVAALIAHLRSNQIEVEPFTVTGEPTIDLVLDGVRRAHETKCDVIIGLGGGSALDAGKAIAALMTNTADPLDYVEVIGRGQPLTQPSAPYIAIPTTAGTGSEVARGAVLTSPEHRVKVSLRSPLMLPRVAIVDPELTYSLPPSITASTGLDALTQLIEPYTCNSPNPIVDAICRDGMLRAARSLPRAYHTGRDAHAREDMSLAALFGGLALANAKLGAVHGFTGTIGGLFHAQHAPHGSICAKLLPLVIEANVRALQLRAANSPVLDRYDEVACILTGQPSATAGDAIAWLHNLCRDLNIPSLSQYGLTAADFDGVIAQSQKASSMKGNPIALSDDELREILYQAV